MKVQVATEKKKDDPVIHAQVKKAWKLLSNNQKHPE